MKEVTKARTAGQLLRLICLACLFSPTAVGAQVCTSMWGDPFSWVTTSGNGKYIFVLLCPRDVDAYLKGSGPRPDAAVLRLASEERELRRKYKVGGLYAAGDPTKPIFGVASFPEEIDRIHVADDGSYVLGINSFVLDTGSPRLTAEDVQGSHEVGFMLFAPEGSGVKPCSKKLADLDLEKASVRSSSEGYHWVAEGDKAVVSDGDGVKVRKVNGEELVVSLGTCSLVNEVSTGQQGGGAAPVGHPARFLVTGALLALIALGGLYLLKRARKVVP